MTGSSRAGFIYLLALIVVIVVSSLAVVMARGAGIRLRAGQDEGARAASRGAALGVLRAVVNDLDASLTTGMPGLVTVQAEGETVGACTVVLVGRDPAGTSQRFGLIDEAGKIDVNSAPVEVLAALPGMTSEIAAAIIDWRDSDDTVDPNGGAERTDGAYSGALVPFAPRNAPFETIDELRLVSGVTDQLFFGEDVNGNGRLDPGEDTNRDGKLTPGLRDLLTIESREPANAPDGTARTRILERQNLILRISDLFETARATELTAQVNAIRTFATRLDLIIALDLDDAEAATLWPCVIGPEGRTGLIDAWSCREDVLVALVGADLAKTIITARPTTRPSGPGWLASALTREQSVQPGCRMLTSGSYRFSADLLAIRNDGAGWSRLGAVIDCSLGGTRVVSIRPLESQGWPLPGATPETIRRGLATTATGSLASFLTSGAH